jgi:hypothetical protein
MGPFGTPHSSGLMRLAYKALSGANKSLFKLHLQCCALSSITATLIIELIRLVIQFT